MLSILSADRLLQADVIYIHSNKEPIGPYIVYVYWNQVRHLLTVIHREPTRILFGKAVKKPMYVARVEIIFHHGGIYKCVLGLESSYKVCSGVFLCEKESPFLRLWLQSFIDDYKVGK